MASGGGHRLVRVLRRFRILTEAECYARCYGGRKSIEAARVPRKSERLSGEELRRLFLQRLQERQAA
jgi:hypothetical protein